MATCALTCADAKKNRLVGLPGQPGLPPAKSLSSRLLVDWDEISTDT